jgi:ABC-2 type transport system permease protein/oleandomycin transport system permease protein
MTALVDSRVPIRQRSVLQASMTVVWRNLLHIKRMPEMLMDVTVQPVMFVLLFRYVFGGAISVPAQFGDYADFLIPGIIVQSMAFGGFVTALGLAEDMQRGIIARFRALPTSRPAVLTGRTAADIATNLLGLAVMIGVGLAVGFSFSTSPFEVVAGILLMLLIGYTFSWVFAWIGLIVSTPESANAFGFIAIFPLTFISSAFVPPDSMPEPLKTFAADINPFSKMVDAARALFLGTPAGDAIWVSVLWCLGLIAVFGALAVNRYRRTVAAA